MLLRKLKLLQTKEDVERELLEAGWRKEDEDYNTVSTALQEVLPVYVGVADHIEITLPKRPIGKQNVAYLIGSKLFIKYVNVYARGVFDLWANDADFGLTTKEEDID